MAKDLAGKVAIITGGAGGIGKALAEEMAERGCYLVLADVNAELLEKTAVELRATGAQLDAKTVDVRDAAQVQGSSMAPSGSSAVSTTSSTTRG